MNGSEVEIRLVQPADNAVLARIIRSVLDDMNVPRKGTTYADPELDMMYETFSVPGACYYVLEKGRELLGGAGIIRLKNEQPYICELQKMYLVKKARGHGLGSRLLRLCLIAAAEMGYKQCYLETMSDMKAAQNLYVREGFRYLDHRMGSTGHYVCPIWMIKELSQPMPKHETTGH